MKMVEVTKFCSNYDLEKDPKLYPTSLFLSSREGDAPEFVFLK